MLGTSARGIRRQRRRQRKLQNLAKDLAKRNQAVIEMEEVPIVVFRKSRADDFFAVDSPGG